ncbi:twin-arginine translocation signal domain-containing protein [Modestobacter sp. VKM Ac-2985]|uniref:twin-arginine translocation signal domain-containing protein n=1 Tax=Modestobacter sp. VKM Ac-2985 TaxID=3004139 RepID=UPI0022AB79FB|nr:twin-arginine translocation signal domain-containing protein [Modestobacter sp. VKM Ac-2985]MCZ2836008.1 twin-arginine translocation signal domain-containing protein [Modestobacter sp. VKM Ac-2985]
MDRRQFMVGASVAAVGTAVAVTGIPPFDDMPTAAAAGEERFSARGRAVVIQKVGKSAHAVINGRHGVHLERMLDGYATHLLPFGTYKSPRKLIEAVIQAEDAGLLII